MLLLGMTGPGVCTGVSRRPATPESREVLVAGSLGVVVLELELELRAVEEEVVVVEEVAIVVAVAEEVPYEFIQGSLGCCRRDVPEV